MFHTGLLILISHIGSLFACWGSVSIPETENNDIWAGWDPPEGAMETWKRWLAEYNRTSAAAGYGLPYDPAIHGAYMDKPYGHGVKGWPHEWGGLGPPMGGMKPPPHAYVPKNMGKPPQCYLPVKGGNCTMAIPRFAYNSYQDQCMSFKYTGCGGNWNNFMMKESCEKACIQQPSSGCVHESRQPIDLQQWSRRCGYYDDQPNEYDELKGY